MKLTRASFGWPAATAAADGSVRFSGWRASIPILKAHSRYLAFGFLLTIIQRLTVLVLPAVSKVVIDDVVLKQQSGLLPLLGLAIVAATKISTRFSIHQFRHLRCWLGFYSSLFRNW
jgi:ABC-type bacteriocin/lantibiotic exporter with double-glycine peptidase domain